MAKLENYLTGKVIVLQAHHLFGRHTSRVETVLTSQDVSKIHASIRWEDQQWSLLDHSRNGTWINKHRLASDAKATLSVGDVLWFGGAKASAWKVIDLAPPKPMLLPIKPEGPILEFEQLCVLPNEQVPELSLYLAENGTWYCESAEGSSSIQDGDLVQHGPMVWKFVDAGMNDPTVTSGRKEGGRNDLQFRFLVSLDEEHVRLQIVKDQTILDLGERVHHYPLLILARHRMADAKEGLDKSSQGWIDFQEFCTMLKMDYFHLNTQIYRARKQILQFLSDSSFLPPVVERRSKSLRFGADSLLIQRGDSIEGQLNS